MESYDANGLKRMNFARKLLFTLSSLSTVLARYIFPGEGTWWDPYRADHLLLGISLIFIIMNLLLNFILFSYLKEHNQLTLFDRVSIPLTSAGSIVMMVYNLIANADAYVFPALAVLFVIGVKYLQSLRKPNVN